MNKCDVCKLEFSASDPTEAVADVSMPGGVWGYVCETHLSHGVIGTFFKPRPCACGKPTKNVFNGRAKCKGCCSRA